MSRSSHNILPSSHRLRVAALAACVSLLSGLPGAAPVAQAQAVDTHGAGTLEPATRQRLDEALSTTFHDVGFPGAVAGVYTPRGEWVTAIGVQNTEIARDGLNPAPAVFTRLAAVLGAPIAGAG